MMNETSNPTGSDITGLFTVKLLCVLCILMLKKVTRTLFCKTPINNF